VVVPAPERRGKGKGGGLSKNRYIAGVSTPQRPNFLDKLRDTLDDDEAGFYQVSRVHSALGLALRVSPKVRARAGLGLRVRVSDLTLVEKRGPESSSCLLY